MQVNIGFFAQYRILCKCHDGARCRSATKRLNIFPASPHRDAPSSHPGCKLPGLNRRGDWHRDIERAHRIEASYD